MSPATTHTEAADGYLSAEAEAMWTYTDGYYALVKTTSATTFAANPIHTVFCFEKTASGSSTSANTDLN